MQYLKSAVCESCEKMAACLWNPDGTLGGGKWICFKCDDQNKLSDLAKSLPREEKT